MVVVGGRVVVLVPDLVGLVVVHISVPNDVEVGPVVLDTFGPMV